MKPEINTESYHEREKRYLKEEVANKVAEEQKKTAIEHNKYLLADAEVVSLKWQLAKCKEIIATDEAIISALESQVKTLEALTANPATS